MALKASFDKEQALAEQARLKLALDKYILRGMQYAGEQFIKDARDFARAKGGFGDVTGNLRSSIGYFIFRDRQLVDGDIYEADKGTDRRTGVSVGRQFALKMAEDSVSGSGFKLIGVAGMDYASAVESRGLNVISVQAEAATVNLDKYLQRAKAELGL